MKTTRDVMTPGRPLDGSIDSENAVGANAGVDDALKTMLRSQADRLAVIDGYEVIGSVTPADLAISIEDTRTWSALCS